MHQLRATVHHDGLPPDCQVAAVEVREGLSALTALEVELVTGDPEIGLEGLLGTGTAVRVEAAEDPTLDQVLWHGQVEEAAYLGPVGDQHRYQLRLRPLLAGLGHRVRSRTFQDKSAVEIVRAVLADAGIPADAVVWQLARSYPSRPFCLQYRESELAFVLRLLEDEGIFFWFEHTEEGHTLHLGDGPGNFAPMPEPALLRGARTLHAGQEAARDLVLRRQVATDAHLTRDWNFERAAGPLESVAEGPEPVYLRHEYPGGFSDAADGLRRARQRLEEAQVPATTLQGHSNCRRLAPGRTFTLTEATPAVLDGDYLVISSTRRFEEPRLARAGAPDGQSLAGAGVGTFQASFTAMPADQAFRPARCTPRPRVAGRECAVVTGPPGEEIHVDPYGRIKVHFYWDREGKIDDQASFWIRVQQQNTSGNVLLPRVGWEVDVGFLDGDPDRPVVLQKLYNRETMPPYALPEHKTQSALQSATSPGGGGTNEVRLQDGNAGMEFAVHASRDLSVNAGNDASEVIAVDAQEEVGLALKTSVGANEAVEVGANQSLSVTADCSNETTGAKTVSVGAVDDWGITGGFSVTCDGNRSEQIGTLQNVLANKVSETFNANLSRTVGAALCINSAATISETVTGSKTETVGGARIELIRGSKAENVGTLKTLTAGIVIQRTGKDLIFSAGAAMAIHVGGPVVEKVGDGYTVGAAVIAVTAPGGGELKVGGSKLTGKGGTLSVKASEMAAKGKALLQLKGRINYRK